MIGWILKFLPGWAWIVAGALVVTLLTGYHLTAVSHARKAGVEQDKARSDGVIAKMILEHAENVAKENAKVDVIEAMMQKVKQGAQDAIKSANAATANVRAAFAAVSGERDKLRDDLSRAIVTGGVEADSDTVAACRDRADRSAKVLQESLRVGAICAGDATGEATRGNTLYESWLQLERAAGM